MPPYRPQSVKKLADNPKYRPYPKVRRDYSSRRATVARVVAMASGEMKYFDTGQAVALPAVTTVWAASNSTDPSTFLCLFAPQVGAAINQRIGRKVHVHKIKIRGQIRVVPQASQGTADTGCKIRVILVQDKQTNATQMQQGQLMNGAASAVITINSFQNLDSFGRFKVLKDKTYQVSNLNLAGSPTGGDVVQAGLIIPFKLNYVFTTPVLVNFNATNGGTIADIVDNSFHVVAATSDTTYAPTIDYFSRVCYKE